MNLAEALRIALRCLRSNRLRAALTTLGIVIGVAAVIVLVGLGDGLKSGFNDQFGPLSTEIVVSKLSGNVPGGGVPRDLKDADVRALADYSSAPHIATVSPVVSGTALAVYHQQQYRCSVDGTHTDYLKMANRELVAGNFFTTEQERAGTRVVVLGTKPVETFFGSNYAAALGKVVRIGKSRFTVIGVVKSNGQEDDAAIMPLEAARSYLIGGTNTVNSIIVRATSPVAVSSAEDELTAILDQRHAIHDTTKRDFNATALGSLLDKANKFLTVLTLFTVGVAAISLIVGAIGITNIMLVSVTERTREIGIRKAVGATRRVIMKQFLIESVLLAGLGGLVGILIGIGLVLVGAAAVPRFAPNLGPPEVSIPAVVIAFGVSLTIGVVAGGYPAGRAAKLRPIEALRYE